MVFDPEAGTEALTVEDLSGGRFETTICNHGQGKRRRVLEYEEEPDAELVCDGQPSEDFF